MPAGTEEQWTSKYVTSYRLDVFNGVADGIIQCHGGPEVNAA